MITIARRMVQQICFAITMTGQDFGSGGQEELMALARLERGTALSPLFFFDAEEWSVHASVLYICIRLVRHPHGAHLLYTQTSEPGTWTNVARKRK
jgi:hypothetical protein